MKRILTLSLILTLGVLGCNQSPRGGGTTPATRPGGGPDTPADVDHGKASETFRLTVPLLATTIKQGDRQTVKLTLDRGKEFKQSVKVAAEGPQGLKVTLEPATVKASDGETVTATIEVAKDAAVGEHTIKFTATPDSGAATSKDYKVKVEKKAE